MQLRIKKSIPVIDEQAKSGMTKNEWCAMHGIERTSFFRWQQKRVRAYLLEQCETQPPQLPSSVDSGNSLAISPAVPIFLTGYWKKKVVGTSLQRDASCIAGGILRKHFLYRTLLPWATKNLERFQRPKRS